MCRMDGVVGGEGVVDRVGSRRLLHHERMAGGISSGVWMQGWDEVVQESL